MRTAYSKMLVLGALAAALTFGALACSSPGEGQRPDDETAEGVGEADTITVNLYNYRFNPQTLTVATGTQITFNNKDPDRHNVSIPALNIDEDLDAGESFSYVFETTGEFAVSNQFASSPMKMSIEVK
jgi:plastocyanin